MNDVRSQAADLVKAVSDLLDLLEKMRIEVAAKSDWTEQQKRFHLEKWDPSVRATLSGWKKRIDSYVESGATSPDQGTRQTFARLRGVSGVLDTDLRWSQYGEEVNRIARRIARAANELYRVTAGEAST